MRNSRTKLLALAILFVGVVFALAANSRPSSGQETNRKPVCGCYVCGKLIAVDFVNKAKDCYGILAADACPVELVKMPEAQRTAYCQKVKATLKFTSFKDSCPSLAPYCVSEDEKPPDTKCEPPAPPWFQPAPECKDIQEAQITQDRRGVVVYLCGYAVFSFRDKDVPSDQLYTTAYKAALRDTFKANMGKVCCNSFRQAARTGLPCNPRVDVDCDGKPNQTDHDGGVPQFDGRDIRFPPDLNFDPFPDGMTDDEIAPPLGECKDCKCIMVSGELKCSPDGRQRHVYQARWLCPSTKVEVDKFHYAPATAPCTPPRR